MSKSLENILRPFVSYSTHSGAAQGPLAGWSIALKDNIDIAGDVVQIGTRLFENRRANATATAAQRLMQAGATLSGRTQLVELCFGSWGLNAFTGDAVNPWDAKVHRAPGGSSAGSAVAVAAGFVRAALGTDTAGSIRMPAALCGVSGFKPTHGLVPLDGVFPLAPSYDSIGPIAASAADCAQVMAVLANDPSLGTPELLGTPRIACLPRKSWPVDVEPAVEKAFDDGIRTLKALGFAVNWAEDVPDFQSWTQHAGVLIAHECWQVLQPYFESHPQLLGPGIRQRLENARDLDPELVMAAQAARLHAQAVFDTWSSGFDALLLPTVRCVAPPVVQVRGSNASLGEFTRWVNHVAGCALAMPAGFDAQGLPVSLQLVGRGHADAQVLAIGMAFQTASHWHLRRPDLENFLSPEWKPS